MRQQRRLQTADDLPGEHRPCKKTGEKTERHDPADGEKQRRLQADDRLDVEMRRQRLYDFARDAQRLAEDDDQHNDWHQKQKAAHERCPQKLEKAFHRVRFPNLNRR